MPQQQLYIYAYIIIYHHHISSYILSNGVCSPSKLGLYYRRSVRLTTELQGLLVVRSNV